MAKIYIWYIGEIMAHNNSNSSNSKYNNRRLITAIIVVAAVVGIAVGYLATERPAIIRGGVSGLIDIKPLDDLIKDSNLIVIGEIIEEKSTILCQR